VLVTALIYGTFEYALLPDRMRLPMRRVRPSVASVILSLLHAAPSALAGGVFVSPVFGLALFVFHVLLESPVGAILIAMQPGSRIHDSILATSAWEDRDRANFQLALASVHENLAWVWAHVLVFAGAWGVHVYFLE
jgi:hypothetical protein